MAKRNGGARVTRLRRDRRRRDHSQTYERRRRPTSPTLSCAARSARTTPTRTHATKRQSVSIVMATWDAESAQMACAVVPPDGTRFYAVSFYFWCSSGGVGAANCGVVEPT